MPPGDAAKGGEMHAERAVPAGTNFPKESFKGGKAAEKAAKPQRRRRKAEISRGAAKDLIGFVRSFCFVG